MNIMVYHKTNYQHMSSWDTELRPDAHYVKSSRAISMTYICDMEQHDLINISLTLLIAPYGQLGRYVTFCEHSRFRSSYFSRNMI